jgi:hypothetical protein
MVTLMCNELTVDVPDFVRPQASDNDDSAAQVPPSERELDHLYVCAFFVQATCTASAYYALTSLSSNKRLGLSAESNVLVLRYQRGDQTN